MKSRLLLYLALVLSGSLFGCSTTNPGQSLGSCQSGPISDGLQMSLSISRTNNQSDPEFEVAIRNVGDKDVCLNLGIMLANGKVMIPDKIHLKLVDGNGGKQELHFQDRQFAGVSGRVDDYMVPLRAGSSYTVKLRLDQFWSPETQEFALRLKPGRYEASAQFQGAGAETSNTDMEGMKLMNLWNGNLQSNRVLIVE